MKNSGTFNITAHGDREIVVTRVFDAPRHLIFDAYTKPELIKQWLLGPDGWSMPVCEVDLRAGGKYRYVWKSDADGREMGMGGIYREVAAPERIVVTEVFDEAWYPGEAVDTIVLVEKAGKTTLTQTILYNSRETRNAVLKSPMQTGMAASYDKLEKFLPSLGREALSA
ncbi:MAG: SRPBCC family protein [Terriglobales bacterium]